ncbi:hypothetical protein ACFWY6_23300 [Streptomyces sp. NPDC059037]|uniref:hypothetical protein n=1 Tax=Streptomyces sp. NPDC059037 TaxID=3346710 RepID=UPI00368CD40A
MSPTGNAQAGNNGAVEIRTLGYANRFATWDSEFRYDGRISAPKGVRIKEIKYDWDGEGTVDHGTSKKDRGEGGTGQEFEVIDTATVGDQDLITFTLRGDLNVDKTVRGENVQTYSIKVEVTLDNGSVYTVAPRVEALNPNWDKNYPEGTGRPFVRLPYDNSWDRYPDQQGGSQAGFGYVTDSGLVHDRTLFINLVNPRLPDEADGYVYYQLVHEDGEPSQLTPLPKKQYLRARNDSSKADWVDLPAFHMGELGEKPGYYRFLVWPQAAEGQDGFSHQYSWDPSKPEDAFQVGSIYFRCQNHLPEWARISLTITDRRIPQTVAQGQESFWPSVTVKNTGVERIGTQTVTVRAPQGMWFTEPRLYWGRNGAPQNWWTLGELSADGTTLTARIPLDLNAGEFATLWAPLRVGTDAPTGLAHVAFEAGVARGAAIPEVTPKK